MKCRFSYILISCVLCCLSAQGGNSVSDNNQNTKLIQLSGFINNLKKNPIPFASVKIKNTFRVSATGIDGFYTFVAKENDTLEYSAVGYKKFLYVVPKQVPDQKMEFNPSLERDTLDLTPVIVSPWPSKEHFRYAFLNLKLNESPTERAMRYLSPEELQRIMETMELDGGEQSQRVMQQIAQNYYYSGYQRNYMALGAGGGTPVPNSLLNPFAWAQFFKAIKEGKYKKKYGAKDKK